MAGPSIRVGEGVESKVPGPMQGVRGTVQKVEPGSPGPRRPGADGRLIWSVPHQYWVDFGGTLLLVPEGALLCECNTCDIERIKTYLLKLRSRESN